MGRQMLMVMAAIIATGALLNVANSGRLGVPVSRASNFVTRGYGV